MSDGSDPLTLDLLKSILHNIGVVLVGLGLAYLGTVVDSLLGLRVWATFHFYAHRMRVISLEPQETLITSGPYRFSRNPLYLGGNVFIFCGAALLFGSPTALLATAVHLPLMDLFIRPEEAQLARRFGEQWQSYRKRVPRWL